MRSYAGVTKSVKPNFRSCMVNEEKTIILCIKQARQRAGMTQLQLSKAIGCSRNHISSLENGACQPSLDLWLKLVKVLKIEAP
jgi:DNA-binding XRE family transcriptional regulator